MNHKFGGRFHYLRLAGVLVPIALVLPKLKLIVSPESSTYYVYLIELNIFKTINKLMSFEVHN